MRALCAILTVALVWRTGETGDMHVLTLKFVFLSSLALQFFDWLICPSLIFRLARTELELLRIWWKSSDSTLKTSFPVLTWTSSRRKKLLFNFRTMTKQFLEWIVTFVIKSCQSYQCNTVGIWKLDQYLNGEKVSVCGKEYPSVLSCTLFCWFLVD